MLRDTNYNMKPRISYSVFVWRRWERFRILAKLIVSKNEGTLLEPTVTLKIKFSESTTCGILFAWNEKLWQFICYINSNLLELALILYGWETTVELKLINNSRREGSHQEQSKSKVVDFTNEKVEVLCKDKVWSGVEWKYFEAKLRRQSGRAQV